MRRGRWATIALAIGITLLASVALSAAASSKRSAPKKSSGKSVPESLQVLVRVGTSSITRGDMQRRLDELPEQYRAQYSTPDGRKQLLDRMVEERVWMMEATKAGVPVRPALVRQIEQQKSDLIIRTYLNEVMASNPPPSDTEAKAYYDQHLAEYLIPATVTIRHIQSKSESDAKKVLSLARNPKEDWNRLVMRYSTDTLTRTNGGLLGTVTRDGNFAALGRQPALAESAFAQREDRPSGPFKTDHGWHVIKTEGLKLESTRPFEQVRPTIVRSMTSTRTGEYYRERLDEARRDLGVTPDSAAINKFLTQKKSARDLFKEAQEAGPAALRIQLYQQLLAEYPDADVSPQAQFMIGFINSEELKDYAAAEQAFHELLRRYPKSELTNSAQWMLDHMRSEDAPQFMDVSGDSIPAAARTSPEKGTKRTP